MFSLNLVSHSRKRLRLHSSDAQSDRRLPVPTFDGENGITQINEVEWNAELRFGWLPSNFKENALSKFDAFELGTKKQIKSKSDWKTKDEVSRRVFRTRQPSYHQPRQNYRHNQRPKQQRSANINIPVRVHVNDDREDRTIYEMVMRYTSNNFNSFNNYLGHKISY